MTPPKIEKKQFSIVWLSADKGKDGSIMYLLNANLTGFLMINIVSNRYAAPVFCVMIVMF